MESTIERMHKRNQDKKKIHHIVDDGKCYGEKNEAGGKGSGCPRVRLQVYMARKATTENVTSEKALKEIRKRTIQIPVERSFYAERTVCTKNLSCFCVRKV